MTPSQTPAADMLYPPSFTNQDARELLEAIQVLTHGKERRGGGRKVYPVVQSFAPFSGLRLPKKSAFRQVACRDISTSGISLIMPVKPESDQVVFALGKSPRLVYVTARVVHCDPCEDPRDGFVVGYRFVNKVNLPA
jgi:hypothetical protein